MRITREELIIHKHEIEGINENLNFEYYDDEIVKGKYYLITEIFTCLGYFRMYEHCTYGEYVSCIIVLNGHIVGSSSQLTLIEWVDCYIESMID